MQTIDQVIIVLTLISLIWYFWAWVRLMQQAFENRKVWGWLMLLLNQPLNIPALGYIFSAGIPNRLHYIAALFAPYIMLAIVLYRYIEWSVLF